MFNSSDSMVWDIIKSQSLRFGIQKVSDDQIAMISHTQKDINLHGIYENATIKSFSHALGFNHTNSDFTSRRRRKVSEEERKAKHREVQRRFIQRKKVPSTSQMAFVNNS